MSMNILVATPGRLLQHIDQTPGFDVSNVRCVVLDEVDRCLDLGFRTSLHEIISALGEERLTMVFSATMNAEVREMVEKVANNALWVSATPEDDFVTPKTLVGRR